jgi:hypothetical protein
MMQDGKGINESKSLIEIEGRLLKRTVYCYTKDNLLTVAKDTGLEFIKEGYLDSSLFGYGWRSYIFRCHK